MQSSAVRSGMPRRVCSARAMASSIRSGEVCRIEPAAFEWTMSVRSPRASSLEHLADLLRQRHPADEVVETLLDRPGRVAIGQGVGGGEGGVVGHVPTLADVAPRLRRRPT